MGIRYSIDASRALVHVIGTGRLTMPEMIVVVDQIADDPRFRSDFPVLFDIRDTEYTAELNDGNEFVAALDRRESAFQKRFALILPPSLQLLGTLFCLLAQVKGIDRIKCFTAMRDAHEWIGLSK
jgi:hypothetical protein